MGIENFEPASEQYSNEYEQEKFLVLEDKQIIEEYQWWVERAIERVKSVENEKGPIGAIICTETSGVPFGYALKAGLKELDNNGPMPKFLKINVKPFKNEIDLIIEKKYFRKGYKEAEEEFQNSLLKWKEKINNLKLEDKNIFILDEFTYSGRTALSARYLLESAGINKEQIFSFLWDITTGYPAWKHRNRPERKKGINPTEMKITEEGKNVVVIVKGKEKREKAQNLIHDMEILGKLAAKELCQT